MKILTTPDPYLRKVAKPVTQFDKKLRTEISSMLKTLLAAKDPEGVGLAATQVGLDRRLFIILFSGKPEVFLNPSIKSQSDVMLSQTIKKRNRYLEGCLSIPGIWGFVDRPYWIEIEYQSLENDQFVTKSRRFEGMESSFVQHENDHLDGILFTDHILRQGGQIFQEVNGSLHPIDNI